MGNEIMRCTGNHSVISPVAVIIAESMERGYKNGIDSSLFNRLPSRPVNNTLMAIARSTWNSPCISIVNPWGTMLEQNFMVSNQQNSGGAM